MEFGLDRAIERLNALKLHVPQQSTSAVAIRTAEENQREDHHVNQEQQHSTSQLQEQYSRMAQQMQEQYERRLKEQEEFLVQRMQQEMQQMQRRIEALEHQNQLLRNAVTANDTYRAQVADQEIVINGLQDQVKQLRITNYRLQYMIQQTDRAGPSHFIPPPPPDIF